MLAIEESEKSQKGSRILMFKNFELKYYRKMGLKQRMGEKSNMTWKIQEKQEADTFVL